jgi:thioesterase domain-containing protein
VEAIASRYLAEVRAAQRSGPYLLGGWSFGGLVAFEMAQQLRAAGETTALLALIDSHAPQPSPEPDDLALLAAFVWHLGSPWQDTLLDMDRLRRLDREDRLADVMDQIRQGAGDLPDIATEQVERWFGVFRAHIAAQRRYTPRAYPGAAVVFRASGGAGAAALPADLGWGAWIEGPLAVVEVPGDHRTVLRAPHASVLSHQLTRHLRAADEGAAE